MAHDARAGGRRLGGRPIRRAVVDDDDLAPGRRRQQFSHDARDRRRFVHGRNDYRDARGSAI